MPRGARRWWVGAVLAVAAGLSAPAPRAAADCAERSPTAFAPPLPFASSTNRPMAHPGKAPCNGPNCRKTPSDPAPPPPAPSGPSPGEDWAWVQSAPAPVFAAGLAWADRGRLLTSLFFPAPLERPPR